MEAAEKTGTEQEETDDVDGHDADQSDKEGLEHRHCRPFPEVAAAQHQRDGGQHGHVGDVLENVGAFFLDNADVPHRQPDDIENDHRRDFLDDGPLPCRKHDEQRDGVEVQYGDDLRHSVWWFLSGGKSTIFHDETMKR